MVHPALAVPDVLEEAGARKDAELQCSAPPEQFNMVVGLDLKEVADAAGERHTF